MLAAGKKNYNEKLKEIFDFYTDDFEPDNLKSQLKVFTNTFPQKEDISYGDIITYFKQLKPELKVLIPEVCKIFELILVLPASAASGERSFSQMKRIKTRLRSRMTAKLLNHFMITGHYKKDLDNLDLDKIADEFISRKEKREKVFGKIKNSN